MSLETLFSKWEPGWGAESLWVWRETMDDWCPISEFPELLTFLTQLGEEQTLEPGADDEWYEEADDDENYTQNEGILEEEVASAVVVAPQAGSHEAADEVDAARRDGEGADAMGSEVPAERSYERSDVTADGVAREGAKQGQEEEHEEGPQARCAMVGAVPAAGSPIAAWTPQRPSLLSTSAMRDMMTPTSASLFSPTPVSRGPVATPRAGSPQHKRASAEHSLSVGQLDDEATVLARLMGGEEPQQAALAAEDMPPLSAPLMNPPSVSAAVCQPRSSREHQSGPHLDICSGREHQSAPPRA